MHTGVSCQVLLSIHPFIQWCIAINHEAGMGYHGAVINTMSSGHISYDLLIPCVYATLLIISRSTPPKLLFRIVEQQLYDVKCWPVIPGLIMQQQVIQMQCKAIV